MSIDRMLTRTALVYRRDIAGADGYGNPARVEAAAVAYPAWLSQTEATEVTDGREAVVSDWILYLPAGAEIDHDDRVEVDGVSFEVAGLPLVALSPGRGAHHVEARLRAVG